MIHRYTFAAEGPVVGLVACILPCVTGHTTDTQNVYYYIFLTLSLSSGG